MSPNSAVKHAVVTGGSRGIGRAVAARLARDGYEVMMVARDPGAIDAACAEMSEEDWRAGFALKFFGAERLTRALWPMLKQSGGAVVNVIGVGGRTPSADFTIGSSVNAACMALTKALADQGIKDGVRVNAVNPGMIATGRLGRWIAALAEAEGITLAEAEVRLPHSMGISRVGLPEEIAAAVAFLAGDEARYCQGTIMDVDGGRTRSL